MYFTKISNSLNSIATTLEKGLESFEFTVLVPKGSKHSVPNKIITVGLAAGAAALCGFPTWFIIMQSLLGFVAALEARRWFVELATVYTYLAFGICVLEPANLISFSILVGYRYLLEGYCVTAERIVRALVAWTKDEAHSYYFFVVLALSVVIQIVVRSEYVQAFSAGFMDGFYAGISGM